MPEKITKSNEEWKKTLSPEEYAVAREKGTERPFTGKYLNNKAEGIYTCVCCGAELFASETKYDSGSGWPSFYQAKDDDMVKEEKDITHGMVRTEILCAKCDSHLGHVFEDGPNPTGLRYCVNSLSLKFKPKT